MSTFSLDHFVAYYRPISTFHDPVGLYRNVSKLPAVVSFFHFSLTPVLFWILFLTISLKLIVLWKLYPSPVYHVYIVLPLTFYLVAIPQLLNVLNFIPDLYPVVLNCFCLLFFIMVVTSAISLKLIVLWKLYPSCPFTTFTLFCRSHFIWLLSRSCSTLSFGAV